MKIHKNHLYTLIIGLSSFPFCAQAVETSPMPVNSVTQTEVVHFAPPSVIETKNAELGNCWTHSLASTRPDAWRCNVSNKIQDPCFTTHESSILWCGVHPEKKETGFPVRLADPLPQEAPYPVASSPWLFELADGSFCSPYTGTLPSVNNEAVRYSCSAGLSAQKTGEKTYEGLLGEPKQGKVWEVQKITFGAVGAKGQSALLKQTPMPVRRVWQ